MRTDRRLRETSSLFLAPWLGATNTAVETWLGFWTAMMPRQQATMLAEFQRQAMQAWTAPLASWSGALEMPARRTAPTPAPAPAEAAPPRIETPPVMAPVIEAAVEAPGAEAAEKEQPEPAALAEPAPARGRKPGRAAAQLRQTPPRKAAPRKPPAAKAAARKPAGRARAAKPGRRTRH